MDNTVTRKHYLSKENIGVAYRRYGIVIILIGFIIIAALANPNFLTMNNISNVLRQVSVNGIIAIGMTFVIINNCIDLSVGSLLGAVGMQVIILMPQIGMIPSMLVGIALGIFVGMLNGISVYKGMPAFIMTMASQLVIKGYAYVISNGQPFPASNNAYKIFGQGFIGPVPVPVIIFIALVAVAHFILRKTTFGRSVYAVGGNQEAARLSGINIQKIRVMVYAISGFLAAVAGIVLTSRLYSADPLLGDNYHSDAIAATVIGGTSMSGGEGSVLKTVAGILIIGIISNLLNLMRVSSYVQMITKGLIIFLAVAIDTWKKH